LFIKTKNSNNTDTVAYYHHDHLQTPIQATDKAGNIVWAASYDAFGKATIITPAATADKPTIESNLRLPGQYEDQETGLHYNYFRYMDTQTGRYITQDPIGLAAGVNRFAYVNGNPVNWIDPEGLMGGSGSGAGQRPPKPCQCPTPPKAPPGACIDNNTNLASYFPATNPISYVALYYMVKNHAPWDYKRRGGPGEYEDFGNFNYGAVTAAMWMPSYIAQNGAGIYQKWRGERRASQGIPFLEWPYGDAQRDAEEIERGRQYYFCGCKS
jgi:RHS repeat-associated protein